jgi:hypothetical protein
MALCLAIEPGALRNFNQILIVGGTFNFGLRWLEFLRFVLHRKSSKHMCRREPLEADGAGWIVIRGHSDTATHRGGRVSTDGY